MLVSMEPWEEGRGVVRINSEVRCGDLDAR